MNEHLEKAHQEVQVLVEEFITKIYLGMSESELKEKFYQFQKIKGHDKNWHPPKIRIGKNTILVYNEKSPNNLSVEEGSLIFIDVGVIVSGYESDYGVTFTFGKACLEFIKISQDAKSIWLMGQKKWKDEKLSGSELYTFLDLEAKKHGWVLDHREGGHPIGKFPRKKTADQVLSKLINFPEPYHWILEVKLLDPLLQFGAFYEEILR